MVRVTSSEQQDGGFQNKLIKEEEPDDDYLCKTPGGAIFGPVVTGFDLIAVCLCRTSFCWNVLCLNGPHGVNSCHRVNVIYVIRYHTNTKSHIQNMAIIMWTFNHHTNM